MDFFDKLLNFLIERLIMFYKISFNHIRTFAEISFLGVVLNHDSYHAFLAIASAMFAYFLALSFFVSKFWRVFMFGLFSVIICQLSVTIKKAVMDVGFRQIAQEKPFGVLFSDGVYGFKAVFMTIGKVTGSFYRAWALDEYSSLESLNYRFFTILVMMLIMWVFIIKKPAVKIPEVIEDSVR